MERASPSEPATGVGAHDVSEAEATILTPPPSLREQVARILSGHGWIAPSPTLAEESIRRISALPEIAARVGLGDGQAAGNSPRHQEPERAAGDAIARPLEAEIARLRDEQEQLVTELGEEKIRYAQAAIDAVQAEVADLRARLAASEQERERLKGLLGQFERACDDLKRELASRVCHDCIHLRAQLATLSARERGVREALEELFYPADSGAQESILRRTFKVKDAYDALTGRYAENKPSNLRTAPDQSGEAK